MENFEAKLKEILADLKTKYHALSVKAEFEAEAVRFEEAMRLKEMASDAGLELAIKIGGCEALKDLYDARMLNADTVVAPMIESPYAAKKYINAVKTVFSKEERKSMNILINIETKCGFEHIEEILNSDYAQNLTGIVFGRSDMAGSLGLSCKDVESDLILDYAKKLAECTQKHEKTLVIGGAVSARTLPFFKQIPQKTFMRFETRKIIFDARKVLQDDNAADGIAKAIEFELLWIKNKQNYGALSNNDLKRINILQSRIA